VPLPVHASWLNQVEIYVRLSSQGADPNDFAGFNGVEARVWALQAYYEQITTPFECKFTRADLDRLLARTVDRTFSRQPDRHGYVT
jgi:hypothetical protein